MLFIIKLITFTNNYCQSNQFAVLFLLKSAFIIYNI